MNREAKGAREVALDVLIAVEERGAYSNLLLGRTLDRISLPPRDRRLATELIYGTIQRLNTLDWILDRFVKGGRAHPPALGPAIAPAGRIPIALSGPDSAPGGGP